MESSKAAAAKAKSEPEAVYSAAQLADNCNVFGTSRAVVTTALKLAGKDKSTVAEARKLIDTFRKKEVK